MRWSSFLGGILALTMLDVVLSSQASAARAGGALSVVATVIRHVMSPAVPLIGDHTGSASTSSTSSTSSALVVVPNGSAPPAPSLGLSA